MEGYYRMLTEDKIKMLKDQLICDETLKDIEDYDDKHQIVIFKDGTQRQLVECITRVMGGLGQ